MDIAKTWEEAQNYIKESKFEKAKVLLDGALEIEPKNANLISERAVVYFHLGEKEKALKELDYCVLLEPQNPYRYSSRAYVKAALKDIDGAIVDYEKCIQIDPLDAIAYNNLGLLLESQGRMKMAKKNFDRADELEGVLKERGIDLPMEEENNKEVLNEESSKGNTWSIIRGTFTDKNMFKEYIQFLKNGFRIKK
ncbi:MAG: tetratricopeptide repeat protein [Flavobacteriales bacterium]|nr:tetratricopeptide repeat protein [Flavobacteriales bacterium]